MSFSDIIEYSIANLKEEQVLTYFKNKGDEEKLCKLRQTAADNDKFFDHIIDILTVSLLWEQINRINSKSILTNLMLLSISAILNDVHHRKNLESLNLPNPRDESLIELNKKLALYLFENDLFSFTYGELYKVIAALYPKCDYTASNEIISYLADSFFDVVLTRDTHTFSYQHRRFSEYFLMLQLEDKAICDLELIPK